MQHLLILLTICARRAFFTSNCDPAEFFPSQCDTWVVLTFDFETPLFNDIFRKSIDDKRFTPKIVFKGLFGGRKLTFPSWSKIFPSEFLCCVTSGLKTLFWCEGGQTRFLSSPVKALIKRTSSLPPDRVQWWATANLEEIHLYLLLKSYSVPYERRVCRDTLTFQIMSISLSVVSEVSICKAFKWRLIWHIQFFYVNIGLYLKTKYNDGLI